MRTTPTAPTRGIPFQNGFAALTLVLLAYVSFEALRPDAAEGLAMANLDKLLHFAAFAALAVPARLSLGPNWRGLMMVVAGLLCYGGLIELVQAFIPGRDSSWLDLLADALGIGAGLALAAAMRRLRPLRTGLEKKV